jgi:TRAP-type C4-dicarboxylate transport system permease small subunit
MGLPSLAKGIEKTASPIKFTFEVIAGSVLAMMMFLTALDVGLRYIFNSPIPGALELVEYMMAVIVPFAVTVTAFNKAHIGVDLIMERFPKRFQTLTACLTNLIAFILYAAITWRCFLNIGEQYASGMTSAVLLIPNYPFVVSLTMAFALLSLITLLHFFEKLNEVLS